MKLYFKLFWFLFLVEIVLTPFLLMNFYLTGLNAVALFKLPLLLSFGVIVLFHLKKRLIWKPINLLFLFFGIFSLLYGLVLHFDSIDSKLFSSAYSFIMPIFSISFGIHFARSYDVRMHRFVKKQMWRAFILISIVLVTYGYFHFVTGSIRYFGFSTRMDFIVLYLISSGHYLATLVGVLLIFVSGKRSITLNALMGILLYSSKLLFSFNPKNLAILAVLVTVLFSATFYAYKEGHLRRFEDTLAFDITDSRAAFIATSGRWNEVMGVYNYFLDHPRAKYIGAGMGAKFLVEDSFYGQKRQKLQHYAHLSFGGYSFLYGLPFAIVLFSLLLFMILSGISNASNFYYLGFVMFIFSSLFGAILFIDHKSWVFVGIAYVLCSDKRKALPISYLHLAKIKIS